MAVKSRTKINLSDIFAIVAVITATIVLLVYGFIRYPIFSGGTDVAVYYRNQLVDTYSLETDRTIILCRGESEEGYVCDKGGFEDFQGPVVVLEIKDGGISIGEETSKRHLCSSQGTIKTGNTPLICLPNSFMAVIVSSDDSRFDN